MTPNYALVENNSFINAPSSMIVPASKYLLAILNSKIADFYIKLLGVTRNGGYFEYKPMFIEQLPIPQLKIENKELAQIERKHSVNHVFSSPTSIINFTSKKPSYDDTRRSGRDNELLQRAQNDL